MREIASTAQGAAGEAERTEAAAKGLSSTVTSVGDVVRPISEIAGEMDLLTLSATIQAARAGKAGKGFAIVTSEVKPLAGQTAKATEDIACTVAEATVALREVTARIANVSSAAIDASGQASMVGRQVRSLSKEGSKMKRKLTRLVRTSVEDVARRSEDRVHAEGAARFVHGGGSLTLDLLDVSSRSISGNAEKSVLPGTEGTTSTASGLSARAIVASSTEDRIGVRFADPAEAATLVAAVSGGALRRAA